MTQAPNGAPSPFDSPLISPVATREPTAVLRHREDSKRSMVPMIAAAAVLLIVLLAGGGYFLFGRSSPATIHVSTTPTDAVIYLDNQPITTSTSSPFVVPNVEPGSHLLEVRKHGYLPFATRVVLTSAQDLTLPPVTLEAEAGAAVAVGGPTPIPAGTGFTLDTVPSGARVFVNEIELPQHTPVVVTDLQAGTYRIRVDNGGQYAPWLSQITVQPGQVMALPAAVLTLRAVSVQFTSSPSAATVTLVRGTERRSVGSTPISADVDVSGGAWIVQMEHAGYRDYEAPLIIAAGQTSASISATMEAAARSTGVSRPQPQPSAVVVAAVPRLGARVGPSTTPPESGGGGGGVGTLRINTRPWSQVFVDGRLIGNTPQMNISLPAGAHTITLVNSEFNIRETISVTIHAGQTETRSLTLTPG